VGRLESDPGLVHQRHARHDELRPAGLWGSHTLSFAMASRGQAAGVDTCYWIAQLSGSTFHLVSGTDPLCGALVPGETVSLSS
jgi:hypothetical protein